MIDRNNWYICDFETVTENSNYFKLVGDTRVLLADSLNWNSEEHNLFTCIEDWWDFHCKKEVSQHLFFHNLSFDGTFILPFLSTKYKYNNSETEVPWDNSYEVFRQGGKIYRIEIFLRKKTGSRGRFRITICCSLRMLNSSIEQLGKSYGMQKHLEDDGANFYDLDPQCKVELYPKRFVDYIKNDTNIALRALKDFEEAVLNLPAIKNYSERQLKNGRKAYNVFNYLTAASLTRSIMLYFLREYNEKEAMNNKYLFITKQTYDFIDNWFRGGVSQVNTLYANAPQKVDPAIMIDVTSAYPYQMTKDLPYGEILKERPLDSHIEFLKIKVKSAKLRPESYECVFLHNWSLNDKDIERFKKELYNFDCYYIREEWDLLNKFYDFEVEKIESYYMRTATFLRDYSESLFNVKNHYGEIGHSGLKQSAKILLNAGYGCLAMRDDFQSYLYFNKEFSNLIPNFKELDKDSEFEYKQKLWKVNRFNELFNFNNENLDLIQCTLINGKKKNNVNKAAAAVITARQRCYLYKKILEIGPKYFLLCDTDSILFGNLPPELKDQIANSCSEELGGWTLEHTPYYFGTYGAKKYAMLDKDHKYLKLRFAGVSENVANLKDNLDLDTFINDSITIENATFEKVYCKSGMILRKTVKEIKKGTH